MQTDELEIVLPEDKPAWEWVRGRALQKVSPTYAHSKLQGAFFRALDDWARDRGEVGVEWRVRIALPGESSRPLVPDVAFISAERFAPLRDRDRDHPPFAPDIAVEILSPRDRKLDVEAKRRDYLAAGSLLVIIVDPATRIVRTYERGGSERSFQANETLTATPFPDLAIDLAPIFARINTPR